jgi:hypothetical protein
MRQQMLKNVTGIGHLPVIFVFPVSLSSYFLISYLLGLGLLAL